MVQAFLIASNKNMESKKYTYRLEKEDYMDWIRYEAKEIDHPAGRKKILLAAVFSIAAVLCAEYILFRNNPLLLQMSAAFGFVLLAGLYGMMSEKNRLKSLYVKYGLDRVEKADAYPTITLTMKEDCFTFSSDQEKRVESYRYSQIMMFRELTRIFLIKTDNGRWQFIAKRAFGSHETAKEAAKIFQSCL